MDGQGFKPLADYVHSLGLKFGIHMMRGIPRQAVAARTPDQRHALHRRRHRRHEQHLPVEHRHVWRGHDQARRAGILRFRLRPVRVVGRGLREGGRSFPSVSSRRKSKPSARRLTKPGRAIVFSTSPGATPLSDGEHVSTHANMWRISDDFWDKWSLLFDAVRPRARLDAVSRSRSLARCRHAADRRPANGEKQNPFHARRTNHLDVAVEHCAFAADDRRGFDEAG